MQADCILVLDDGKVAQMGTHQELINQDGIYKCIYDIQMNSEDRKELFSEELPESCNYCNKAAVK